MINEWYYQRDGEEIGPVPFEQIKDLAQSGQLSPEDQIRDAVQAHPEESASVLRRWTRTET